MTQVYRFMSPMAHFPDDRTAGETLATRPATLDGVRITLLPNYRPGAVELLGAVGQLLSSKYPGAIVDMAPQWMDYKVPGSDFIAALAKRTQAVVTAAGD